MTQELAGFKYHYRSGSHRTLLVLHGTGGNEYDLVQPFGLMDPAATIISPRGKVLENGMPRFFRRFAEGVFDFEDVAVRAKELAEFIGAFCRQYELDPNQVIAAGYSNGANIAAALLLLHPGVLAGAALFRAMVPVAEGHPSKRSAAPLLPPVPVLLASGRRDPIARPEETERLAELLRGEGAEVTMYWHPGGHEMNAGDVEAGRKWLAGIQ